MAIFKELGMTEEEVTALCHGRSDAVIDALVGPEQDFPVVLAMTVLASVSGSFLASADNPEKAVELFKQMLDTAVEDLTTNNG